MTEQPAAPTCASDGCVTCSDEALPVLVTELLAHDLAVVDTGQGLEQVSVALVCARPGDVILVHAKEAIAVLDRSPAPSVEQVASESIA